MNLMPKAKCCVFVDFCSLFRFVVMPTPDVVFSYALVDVACWYTSLYLAWVEAGVSLGFGDGLPDT